MVKYPKQKQKQNELLLYNYKVETKFIYPPEHDPPKEYFLPLALFILETCKLTPLELFSNFLESIISWSAFLFVLCLSKNLIILTSHPTLNLEGTSIVKVSHGSMDAQFKPFGGCFNSSFGASEYACRDFF